MILLTLIAALVAERFLSHYQSLRSFGWFDAWSQAVRARLGHAALWEGPFGVLAVLAPVLFVTGLLQQMFHDTLLNLPGLVFGVVVLLYCLGPRDLDAEAEAYNAAIEDGDEERARQSAAELLGAEMPADPWSRARAISEVILAQANERLFAVLFWYVLLGPLGALLFRLAARLSAAVQAEAAGTGFAEAARRLHYILGWLPARLAALGYALSGSFEDALHGFNDFHQERSGRYADPNSGLLICTGGGALRLDAEAIATEEHTVEEQVALIKAALGLMWRTLLIWVGVLLLLTLAGWAG